MTSLQPLHRITFVEWQTYAITLPARSPQHAMRRAELLRHHHGTTMFEETGGSSEDWIAVPVLIDNQQAASDALTSIRNLRLFIEFFAAHHPRYFPLLNRSLINHITDLTDRFP